MKEFWFEKTPKRIENTSLVQICFLFSHHEITSLYTFSALELDPFEVRRSNKLFHAAQGLCVCSPYMRRAVPVAYNHPQAARFVSCGGVIFYGVS